MGIGNLEGEMKKVLLIMLTTSLVMIEAYGRKAQNKEDISSEAYNADVSAKQNKKKTGSIFSKIKNKFKKQKVLSQSETDKLEEVLDPISDWGKEFSKDKLIDKGLSNPIKSCVQNIVKFAKKAETKTEVSEKKDREIRDAANGIIQNIKFIIINRKENVQQLYDQLEQLSDQLERAVNTLKRLSDDHPTSAVLEKSVVSFEKIKRGIELNLKNLNEKTSSLRRSNSAPAVLDNTQEEDDDDEEDYQDAVEE